MATPKTPLITDIVDELIELPDAFKHLCVAQNDDGTESPGFLRLVLNREVMELSRDVTDELEGARGLPDNDHPGSIGIADAVVIFLGTHDPEVMNAPDEIKAQIAKEKAGAWYSRQKRQAENDALFVAMSMYNELNIFPTPYKEGEIAFRVGGEQERQRAVPAWLKPKGNYEIPLPARNVGEKGNIYENRLKQLHQIADECGTIWSLNFKASYEKGLMKLLALAEPRDDAGFPTKSSDSKVHAKSRAKDKDAVG